MDTEEKTASVTTEKVPNEAPDDVPDDIPGDAPAPEVRCYNCQALINGELVFCPECGAPQKKVCPHCGAELDRSHDFCPECGQRFLNIPGTAAAGIAQYNAGLQQNNSKKNVLYIILGAAGICVLAAILVFTVLLNPQRYLENGDYQKAYNVARGAAKEDILRENIAAVVSSSASDTLKDPDSFVLKDAWVSFTDSSKVVFLKISATNSFGGTVINYWHYSWDKDKGKYTLFTSFADFDKETTYSWDTATERAEKLLNNAAKEADSGFVSGKKGVRLSADSVKRINGLFAKGKLKGIALLDIEPEKTPN